MARRQYFVILVCVLAVLACLFVWRGQITGFARDLSDLPARVLSRVSHIAQMVKSPVLDFSEQEMEGIKRELELEIIREEQEFEQEQEQEPEALEEIEEKVDEVITLPFAGPYTGISKERIDWINMNALSKEMIREAQVLSKQVRRSEQGNDKTWDQSKMESELREIQGEAETLKGELDKFEGEQSEIIDIQIELIQVLVQARGLKAAIGLLGA